MTHLVGYRFVIGAALVLAGTMRPVQAQEAGLFEPQPSASKPALETMPPIKALPDRFDEAVGTWDLSAQGTNRRCTLALSVESGRNGRILRFPAGCRRALPILGKVAGWLYLQDGIRFVDENVRPILVFEPNADKASLFARAESGETYNFVPLQTTGMLPTPPVQPGPDETLPGAALTAGATVIPDVAGARGIPGAEPVLPANTLSPPFAAPQDRTRRDGDPSPGIYALDRFSEKDVCRIELTADRTGGKTNGKMAGVRLLDGCRDNGITVFDPVAWRFANGHMTLRARKGHAINLVATREGTWRRDPDTGVTFVLRKVD